MPRMLDLYRTQIVPELSKRFGYTSPMAVPRMVKVAINMGVGKAVENEKRVAAAVEELSLIAGQRAVATRAKASISNFRLKEKHPIGCRVTLRGARMYEFIDRMFNVAVPRIRDYRGFSPRSFDGRGGYTLGLSEQSVFPEIAGDKIEFVQGMDITFVTTARTNEEARALLEGFGMKFRK